MNDELLADVEEAMRDVVDPELGINVVDLGLVYGLNVEQGEQGTVALIDMTLTSAADLPTKKTLNLAAIKTMVAQIQAMGAATPEMDDLVAELACAVEHHVKEERDLLFPKARSCGLDLEALADRLRA